MNYVLAAGLAFLTLAYELAFFHTATYLFGYIYGYLSLALVFSQMGAGGWLASHFLLSTRALDRAVFYAGLGLLFSVPLCLLPLGGSASEYITFRLILLGLPLVPLGFALSHLFANADSAKLYAADLAGASLSACLFVVLWPRLGHENYPLLLASLGFLLSLFFTQGPKKLSLALLVLSTILLSLNFDLSWCNFAALAQGRKGPNRIFSMTNREVAASRPDLVQRVDLFDRGYWRYETCYDASSIDELRNNDGNAKDRRLGGAMGIHKPTVLIIGTAVQGIVKSVKQITDMSKVVGLEINEGAIDLMEREFYTYSKRAYQDLDLRRQDARNYLETPGPGFDMITFMNTHCAFHIAEALAPDYMHTAEGIKKAFQRLNPQGFLDFEERNPSNLTERACTLELLTILQALRELGIQDPTKHLIIFEWWLRPENQITRRPVDRFLQFLVTKEPISPQQREFFKAYSQELRLDLSEEADHKDVLRNLELLYCPGLEEKTHYLEEVKKLEASERGLRDDRPYPGWAQAREGILPFLGSWLLASALFAGFLNWASSPRQGFLAGGLSGMANAMLQTLLTQRFQLLLGSITLALLTSVGGYLLCSGLGSHWLGNARRPRAQQAVLLIVSGALTTAMLLSPLHWLSGIPTALRWVFLVVAMAPLAMVQGSILPQASLFSLTRAGRAQLFGCNSATAALGVLTALLMCYQLGHTLTILLSMTLSLLALASLPGVEEITDAG